MAHFLVKSNGELPTNGDAMQEDQKDVTKEDNVMSTDLSISNDDSSLSPSEPMDCNSTPNFSPAHGNKTADGSSEDVAMSENSVSLLTYIFYLLCLVMFL